MVVYLYRWKLKPGREEDFQRAWSFITEQLREKSGSLGSRLHSGDDGLHYGYAQWPNRAARENSQLTGEEFSRAREIMRDAAEETLPDIVLDPLADFLLLEPISSQ